MKKWIFLGCLILFTLEGIAQEAGASRGVLIEREKDLLPTDERGPMYLERLEVNTSLSFLAPEFPSQQFELRDADIFKKNGKRQVNVVAMMEQQRRHKESRFIELDSPLPALGKGEKNTIQISNQVQMHNRGSNYDIYTGEKKIPAYTEMRAGLFNGFYRPSLGGRFYSPYGY